MRADSLCHEHREQMAGTSTPLDLTSPFKRRLFEDVHEPDEGLLEVDQDMPIIAEQQDPLPVPVPVPQVPVPVPQVPVPVQDDNDIKIQLGSVANTFWIVMRGEMSYLDNLKQIFVQRSGQHTLLYMLQRDCPFGIIRKHATHTMDDMEEADLIYCNDPVDDEASTATCYNGSTFHLRNGNDADFFSHQGSLWQCQDCQYGTTQYSTFKTEHLNKKQIKHELFIKQQHQPLSWGKYQASRKKDGTPW